MIVTSRLRNHLPAHAMHLFLAKICVFSANGNPNRYAWFNGVDPKAMRATDGTLEGAEQCVEVESYKGKQEWECE